MKQRVYKRLAALSSGLVSGAVDFILPPRCFVSGAIVSHQGVIAPHIWRDLQFISAPLCDCCGFPFPFGAQDHMVCGTCLAHRPPYEKARAALVYDDASRDMILKFKHGDQPHAAAVFIPWMKRVGAACLADADYLVPIPLHPFRLMRRRYNQAALLAGLLAEESGVPMLADGLIRKRATKTQGHLDFRDRQKNVRKAFAAKEKHRAALAGKAVVLVDDVYTTGATVNECTRALLQAGVTKVSILTIARVVRT